MGAQLGRYEILSEIAQGGMAAVYLGRVLGEGGFERLVALKVMHPHIANDPEFVAMFLDEARLAAKIRHPNVVPTLDIQKTGDGMFLVMDYIDGPALQDLRKYLKRRRRRLPVDIVVRIFVDILHGLQSAHDLCDTDGEPLNLVHRDVTPHNILIGKDGIARITDFGVARAEARLSSTRAGQLKGKMSYMAPEHILVASVDHRADVYSAGVVLWEALTGQRLFKAENEGALLHKVLQGVVPPPHEVNREVPEQISLVVMRALAHNVDQRYQSAETFADALEAAARVAGVGIAKPKKVGALIREVGPAIAKEKRARSGDAQDVTPATDPAQRHPALLPDVTAPIATPDATDEISQPSGPAIQQLSQPTEPSGVFGSSWTHPEAIFSASPPSRNRHGLIAAIVAGSVVGLVVVALVAVATTSDDAPTAAAPGQSPTTTAAPPAGLAGEPSDEPSYLNEPEPEPPTEPTATATESKTEPTDSTAETPPSASATSKPAPTPRPVPGPRVVPRPRPRPTPKPTTDPKPAGTNFRPKGL